MSSSPPSFLGKGGGGVGFFSLLAALLAATIALSAQPPMSIPDPLKKIDTPPKAETAKDKDAKPLVVKLPDGTFLWLGGASDGERVTLTPQEFQKLLDRVENLKKELAARKPAPPSGCAIRGRVAKRGEQLVASLKLTYSFRTTQANAAVALGGRKAFLVAAALDGAKLPVLDTGEDGFAVTVETAGDHALVLDVEAPVTARGAKAEVGFDLGLPRAPITTLALDSPQGDVKRVNLVTRTPDPAAPTKAPEPRRLAGLDIKQLTAKDGHTGLPLGPVETLEVTWDPPASIAQPADQVQSADFDIGVVLTDGFVESTAKVKLSGPARDWKLVAPANADVSVERVSAMTETSPTQQPAVTKPSDANKPVWKIELPTGSTAADWTITAVVRQQRPKGLPKGAQVPVGPFAVLDVLRQTGTVKVTAGPHMRFVFKHGPDLRRAELPGPPEEDRSVALFRLATGPTGTTVVNAPLLTVEAWPVEGAVRVRPEYRLKLSEAGWRVEARINVKPIRTEVDSVVIDVPTEWRGLESESDPEVVEGVNQGKADGPWRSVTVRLAGFFKQPFTVVLVGTVPVAPGGRDAVIPLPRFPKAVERDATITATVPEGLEVHGTARGWDGDAPAAWGTPLAAVPGADGKTPKAVAAVTGKGERGLARVALTWQPYRPDISADMRIEVTVGERQVVVSQVIKLRSADGFPKPVRFRGPAEALGLTAKPALDAPAAGVWSYSPPVDQKESTMNVSFALPLPVHADGPLSLPVGLLWPAEASRVETNVRVWVNSVTGRTVSSSAAGWRELPPEPVPNHDALPSLVLVASAEHPLVLDVRHATPDSAAAVWVERALIEAGMTDDGSVSYRARFRLQRWLTPAVEVWLPHAVGPNPTARLDGAITALLPVGEGDGARRFRVSLPEGTAGRAAVLDVQYALPGSRHVLGETVYQPPRLVSAAYSGPTRWFITEPADAAPLLFSGRAKTELRWRWRSVAYAPAAPTRSSLDRWFTAGVEPGPEAANGPEGEAVAVRQTIPEAVRVVRVPWVALVVGCSLVVFVVVVALTWLRTSAAGLLISVLGGAFGIGVVLYPQPATQVVAAGQPGLALGLFAIAVQAMIRWQVRRRVTHLPGFTRTHPEPSRGCALHGRRGRQQCPRRPAVGPAAPAMPPRPLPVRPRHREVESSCLCPLREFAEVFRQPNTFY